MRKLVLAMAFVTPVLIGWSLSLLTYPVNGILAIGVGFAFIVVAAILHHRHHRQLPLSSLAEYCAFGVLSVLLYLAIL